MKNRIMGLFALLIIALSTVGVAYAHWEKIITITGTVETGKLHLTPSFEASLIQTKPVATIKWEIKDNDVYVTIGNAYPCLVVEGMFDLVNDGTIPAGLYDLVVTPPTGCKIVITWITPTEATIEVFEDTVLIATGKLVLFGDFAQIDQGKTVWVKFALHFEEGLKQTSTYEFKFKFVYYNWNEVPP